MPIYPCVVTKQYSRAGTQYGYIPVRAENSGAALEILRSALRGGQVGRYYACLQTNDPRILWMFDDSDPDSKNALGDLIDFSFTQADAAFAPLFAWDEKELPETAILKHPDDY